MSVCTSWDIGVMLFVCVWNTVMCSGLTQCGSTECHDTIVWERSGLKLHVLISSLHLHSTLQNQDRRLCFLTVKAATVHVDLLCKLILKPCSEPHAIFQNQWEIKADIIDDFKYLFLFKLPQHFGTFMFLDSSYPFNLKLMFLCQNNTKDLTHFDINAAKHNVALKSPHDLRHVNVL